MTSRFRFLTSAFLILVCASSSSFFSCSKDEPVQPPPDAPEDTTSHDFRWDVTYFDNSYFWDVFAINDSDVWAVGRILLPDSTGIPDDANPFNAAHWDGKQWKIVFVPSVNSSGNMVKREMMGVFAFGSDDVWMLSYAGSYSHWNGKEWSSTYIKEKDGSLNRIFGFSSNDLYLAGTSGAITHWDGKSFSTMKSGVKYPYEITDIWGVDDGGEKEVWAIARVRDQIRSAILHYKESEGRWDMVWSDEYGVGMDQPYKGIMCSIYSYALESYFLVNSVPFISQSVYEKNTSYGPFARISSSNLWTTGPYRLRGTCRNDVFVVGDRMLTAHFNGRYWKYYAELGTTFPTALFGLSVIRNSMYAVGRDASRGVILHGERVK